MCNRGDCICNVFPQPGPLNRGHANNATERSGVTAMSQTPVLLPNERRILRLG